MATFAALSADVAAVGGLDYATEQTTSDRWTKAGLRMLNQAGAWEWLHAHTSFSFANADYDYNFSAIASDLFRIDARSIRYGDSATYLQWGHIQAIDEALGPDWKDSGAKGTPQYATRVGNALWVATVPNAAFVADNPTGYFYYWRYENYTGTLYLPEDFYDCALDAALAQGYLQEDDPRATEMLSRVLQVHLPSMRGAKMDIGARDKMELPRWAREADSVLDYGDGWVRSG